MECMRCYREVIEEATEIAQPPRPGTSKATETSGVDWIACQACGLVVCQQCSRSPESVLCDWCIDKYDLTLEQFFYGFFVGGSPTEPLEMGLA